MYLIPPMIHYEVLLVVSLMIKTSMNKKTKTTSTRMSHLRSLNKRNGELNHYLSSFLKFFLLSFNPLYLCTLVQKSFFYLATL
jgi:hypothetical protein